MRAASSSLRLATIASASILSSSLFTACSRDGSGPPELFENGSGSITESDIRALIAGGGQADLIFPVKKLEGGAMDVKIHAKLIDISKAEETTLAESEVTLEQNDALVAHSLRVVGLPGDLERPKTAPIVIAWNVELPDGALYGKKSLYAALGKLEIQLRGATEIPAGGAVPFRVIVRDPDTLAPTANAHVVAAIEDPAAILFEADTDANGEVLHELALPADFDSGTMRVEVRIGDTTSWARATVSSVHPRKIALSTDKTIYKPGQTVELRALALDASKKPVAGEDVTFEALDGKGNKVFKRHVTTDDFGVAALPVPTDSTINEGTWSFRAIIDGAKAERKIPVQRYNLPKIKVTVTPEREYAIAGDMLRGSIDARYLFGLPVTNATVNISATIKDQSYASATVTTDQEGHAAYQISLPAGAGGTEVDDGDLTVLLDATVIDSAGQTEHGQAALPLAPAALVIKAIAEAGALVPGIENLIYIVVSDPVGRPLVATLNIDGLGPLSPLTTDANGVAELRFTPAEDASELHFQVRATDGANRTHTRDLALAKSEGGTILVRTDKTVYQSGDTAMIRVLTSAPASRVYLDVYKGGEGVETRTLDIVSGSAETMLTVSDAMKGVLLIDAFALGGSGTVVRGSQRMIVDPQDRLEIILSTDREQYAPGDEASVHVRVRDAAGAPQIASLGVTGVDEAVFALGGDADDNLRKIFNLDARILPAELHVLGRNADSLFSSSDLASDEQFARILFASAKNAAFPGLDYNSIREELPIVRSSLEGRVTRDLVAFLKSISPIVRGIARDGGFTQMHAENLIVAPFARRADMFGRTYKAALDSNSNWQNLIVRSAGPDEVHGTADDVEINYWYGWVQWADAKDVDEQGVLRGGFGGELDNGAGGFPVPQAEPPAEPAHMSPGSGSGAKVRSDFRETIYANPTLITDASGEATLSIPLADSITTWRLSAQGSTRDGKLGSARFNFRTFQNFFIDFDMPANLTRGDTVELSAVVYNYLPTAANVRVVLEPADWLTVLSNSDQTISLGPSEVRAVRFTVRAERAGEQALSLRGEAGAITDALTRAAHVLPDGAKEDQSFSDRLNGTREHTITLPADAIEGGTHVALTLTPGFAAEAVQGTEALLKEPGGCFEQTTSSAWPNTLVTNYLDVTGQLTPELKEKSIALVTRGYQRLLTFESPTGGFNWWGDSDPGNRILSAIMLWHLKDMEPVIETDDAVRERTLSWLLDQQRADGSWESGDALHAGNEVLGTSDARTTAFITWALAHTGWADAAVERAAGYLRANAPDGSDLYATALAANALAIADPAGQTTSALFAELDDLKIEGEEGRVKWPTTAPSWTGTSGDIADIETTGLVAYALLKANAYPQNAAGAVKFIVSNKDAVGTWYNTQATMNALRALLAAASPRGSEAEGTLSVTVNGVALQPITVAAADGDVYRELDLTGFVHAGDNTVALDMQGTGELSYLLSRRVYRPRSDLPANGPLALTVSYDQPSAAIGESVAVHVGALYSGPGVRDQVLVRVGRAPGFVPRTEELDQLVASHRIARYEVNDRDVTMYLMAMQSSENRDLSFHFVPTLAVDAEVPASVIYAYYEPSIRAEVAPLTFHVQ